MIVEMSLVVTGAVSGRGSSPIGFGVVGVAPSILRVGGVWWAGASAPGVGGAIGRMTVGGRGRLSMDVGVVLGEACIGLGLIMDGCWPVEGDAWRVGF
jgi:hypothetical protein